MHLGAPHLQISSLSGPCSNSMFGNDRSRNGTRDAGIHKIDDTTPAKLRNVQFHLQMLLLISLLGWTQQITSNTIPLPPWIFLDDRLQHLKESSVPRYTFLHIPHRKRCVFKTAQLLLVTWPCD